MAPTKSQTYAAQLRGLTGVDRDGFLRTHSGLPGPRANLELAQAAADVADLADVERWLGEPDDYLPLCGAIALGRLIAEGDDSLWPQLRETAADQRWRVREGVAMGLQRIGDADPDRLVAGLRPWLSGPPLVRRAAVAGICEPRLLKNPATAVAALESSTRPQRRCWPKPTAVTPTYACCARPSATAGAWRWPPTRSAACRCFTGWLPSTVTPTRSGSCGRT